jgi:hypothetical protein
MQEAIDGWDGITWNTRVKKNKKIEELESTFSGAYLFNNRAELYELALVYLKCIREKGFLRS